ncbi:MAG: D-2-hydroxyacid dehydrogenase [Christensenellales bacterium]|jgi:glycerate dehydrogenase
MKIVVLDGYALNPGDISWDGFKALGEFALYDHTVKADIVSRIGDAGAVLTNKTPITRETMLKCPDMKYIGVLATGYNVVDVEAAAELGVTVTNIPTYGTDAVAQYAIAMMLELCHHIGEHNRSVKLGEWQKSRDFCYWNYPTIELSGKTLGIIGFGRIGQKTARIATALGLNVLAYDKHPNENYLFDGVKYATLDELLNKSDFISLNCPLTQENKGIINKDNIAKMKDGVYIINTARGPLINEKDLYDALNSGKVGGAAVDVLNEEPPKEGNLLIEAVNCIVTPHIAWAAKESRTRLMDIAVNNLKAYMEGKPVNTVI